MLLLSETAVVSSFLIFLIYKLWIKINKSSNPPLPPGPPPEPIIGNFRQIPKARVELAYIEWGKKYSKFALFHIDQRILTNTIDSDVLYISLLGAPVVILNSVKAAVALLDKRGSHYSDRPSLHFYAEYDIP
jgi:hypothetical protein